MSYVIADLLNGSLPDTYETIEEAYTAWQELVKEGKKKNLRDLGTEHGSDGNTVENNYHIVERGKKMKEINIEKKPMIIEALKGVLNDAAIEHLELDRNAIYSYIEDMNTALLNDEDNFEIESRITRNKLPYIFYIHNDWIEGEK